MRKTSCLSLCLALLAGPALSIATRVEPNGENGTTMGASELETRADLAWERRSDGATPATVPRQAAIEAVDGYRAALAAAPKRLDLRIKLLRAIVFLAEYATPEEDDRRVHFEEGREIFEVGLEQLERGVGRDLDGVEPTELASWLIDTPEAGPLYFYGALHWGLWGRYFGKMASLRRGVAKRIRELGEAAIALDPGFDGGGPYRLVGRLHAEAPRVPFITGWVSRSMALTYLQRARELGPQEPLNPLFLAEAYLELYDDPRTARRLLTEAARMKPRADRWLEDQQALTDISALLRSLEAD